MRPFQFGVTVNLSSSGKPAAPLTAERIREILHYDPDTGVFTWRVPKGKRVKAGSVAGSMESDGYVRIKIDDRKYRSHRLAWLYVNGCWPIDQLDHINGSRSDNRIANLREATNSENQQNRAMPANNTSGFTGASFDRVAGRWKARIRVGGKLCHLGYFSTASEAHAAYLSAKARFHAFNPTVRGEE